MDEFEFYPGTHSGAEIDAAVDAALYPSNEITWGSSSLVTGSAAFKAIGDRIIVVQLNGLTGDGNVGGEMTWNTPSGVYAPIITGEHVVAAVIYSYPKAIPGLFDFTPIAGGISYSGEIHGTTDVTLVLVNPGGTLEANA